MSILMSIWEGLLSWITPRRSKRTDTAPSVASNDVEAGATSEDENSKRHFEMKKNMISSQREREQKAKKNGKFTKNQRVRYLHKSTGIWYDAHIAAVHYDDGPEHPYYTIVYQPSSGERAEKQTTQDRLEFSEWDEDRSWEILSAKLARR